MALKCTFTGIKPLSWVPQLEIQTSDLEELLGFLEISKTNMLVRARGGVCCLSKYACKLQNHRSGLADVTRKPQSYTVSDILNITCQSFLCLCFQDQESGYA